MTQSTSPTFAGYAELRNIVRAWEATPPGQTSVSEIQRWLIEDMKPAIDAARAALDTRTPGEGEAQCCMCGKKGLSTVEGDGGPECQLEDGRWTCSADCYYRAADALPKPVAAGVTDRDFLGRKVREAWIKWALTQPNPKPSWLVPYDELSEPDKEADRQIGDAIAALSLLAPETEGFVLREPGEEVVIFLQGVGGIVEASRAEQSQLWGYHHETRRWEENLSGYGQVVGRLGDMPICISLCTANISGRKILFWHATSQVVDYRLIDAWLDKNLPRVPKTDAANFVNILPTLTKEPNKNG